MLSEASRRIVVMLTRLRKHLLGNAVAYAALFVALGGTSYAAATLPKNSVGTAQIKNGSITPAKLKNNSIPSTKIKNGTLVMTDFKPGALKVSVKTVKGPQGPPGATNVQIRTVTGAAGSDARYTATAVCNAGERAVGGGAALIGGAHTNDHVMWTRPGLTTGSGGFGASSNVPNAGDTPNAWTAEVYSAVSGRTLSVYVICAAP